MSNYQKTYIGKGKFEINHFGNEEMSMYINTDKSKDFVSYGSNGSEILFCKVAKMQKPDDKGYTHTVYVLSKKEGQS